MQHWFLRCDWLFFQSFKLQIFSCTVIRFLFGSIYARLWFFPVIGWSFHEMRTLWLAWGASCIPSSKRLISWAVTTYSWLNKVFISDSGGNSLIYCWLNEQIWLPLCPLPSPPQMECSTFDIVFLSLLLNPDPIHGNFIKRKLKPGLTAYIRFCESNIYQYIFFFSYLFLFIYTSLFESDIA